jgi:hypothetical protein
VFSSAPHRAAAKERRQALLAKIQTNLNNSTSNDSNPQQARGTFVPT